MSRIRRQWFELTSGLFCFAWAFLGWLTVIPNQDILADGIQAQSLLTDPRIVLAFPGQKHGGPLEYPATLLAEWLSPGNYFANAAIRPVLAFITGFLVAKLFLALFPNAARWAFLAAVAVGPTILHGLLGAEGNTVGVWWLQPNWDMAWLLVVAGAMVLAYVLQTPGPEPSKNRWFGSSLLAGLLLGLGFYAHPAIILLLVPIVALVLLRSRWSLSTLLLTAAGAAVGALPAAISYVVNAGVNTWDPSHGAFIAMGYYRSIGASILGLDGIPDYMSALLPYSLGLPPSTDPSVGRWQSMLMWILVLAIVVTTIVGLVRSLRSRTRPSIAIAFAMTWTVASITMFGFVTFIDPVWIYSSGLGILLWLSVGALPAMFAKRWIGNGLAAIAIGVMAISTITHNWHFYSDAPARFQEKVDEMSRQQDLADALVDAGAGYVFGSYYDVIPVGYASGMRLRTITNRYNRFPLTAEELAGPDLIVATKTVGPDPWALESLTHVKAKCKALPGKSVGAYQLFSCPPQALVFNK
ncbi:MAG: hypothetical protein Q7K25_00235 [Actinomycetota bacterium]|nr:hypothetical protein [Actinomycetota bacterium]